MTCDTLPGLVKLTDPLTTSEPRYPNNPLFESQDGVNFPRPLVTVAETALTSPRL